MLEHVRTHGSVRIDELAEQFAISPWTVRRDLQQLEQDGLLRRTHGGAFVRPDSGADAGVTAADDAGHQEAKARIGRYAASLIADDSTVMVLGGSTTTAMLPHLAGRRLTVVTNGLEIAYHLRHAPDISVVMLGGMLHRAQMTLLGALTEAAMADLHVDLIVAGAHGVDPEVGVTGAKIAQAGHHRGMLSHTDALTVLADSGKLGRRGSTVLAGPDQIDTLITDTDADTEIVARLRDRGMAVELV
jgi:DeoR/GlpR family transcriptional regulator of sugar metabolism